MLEAIDESLEVRLTRFRPPAEGSINVRVPKGARHRFADLLKVPARVARHRDIVVETL